MIQSALHGDMQKPAETAGSLVQARSNNWWNSQPLGIFAGDQSVPVLEHDVAAEDVANTSACGKGVIGRLLYDLSQALVLTAITGTTASASPATLTAAKTILLPGFTPRLSYGPTLRKIPLRFRLFPNVIGGNVGWYSLT